MGRSLFGPFPFGRAGAQALSLSNVPQVMGRTQVSSHLDVVLTQCHVVLAPLFLGLHFLICKMHPIYIIGLLCSSDKVIVMKAL